MLSRRISRLTKGPCVRIKEPYNAHSWNNSTYLICSWYMLLSCKVWEVSIQIKKIKLICVVGLKKIRIAHYVVTTCSRDRTSISCLKFIYYENNKKLSIGHWFLSNRDWIKALNLRALSWALTNSIAVGMYGQYRVPLRRVVTLECDQNRLRVTSLKGICGQCIKKEA